MPSFYVRLRLRQQRHTVVLNEQVTLAVTNNSSYGTTCEAFTALANPGVPGPPFSAMGRCIGQVNPSDFRRFMNQYINHVGPVPGGHGGPRTGQAIYIQDAVLVNFDPTTGTNYPLPAWGTSFPLNALLRIDY
jgi:hypothetical protein